MPLGDVAYHVPVLLKECVDGLVVRPGGVYVDVTFGGGGHSREILNRLSAGGRLFGFDQDADAMANALHDARFTFVRSNFRYLKNWMRYYRVQALDGLLADFGVSSHHLDEGGRGFSFRSDDKLDMRMNQNAHTTAADVVNDYDEERLADIFRRYGELRDCTRLAKRIVEARQAERIETTGDLADVAASLFAPERRKKEMAKLFQALRMEVNHELDAMEVMLADAVELLRPGGRLVTLTYHSLEDRMVKNFIKTGNAQGQMDSDFFGNTHSPMRPVNRKVSVPDAAEQASNPRSRSAKLRIAEKNTI